MSPTRDLPTEDLLGPRIRLGQAPNVEIAKLGVFRAGFVEPHLGHELLEVHGIFGKEGDAPFPLIETDRTRNNLCNPARVTTAGEAVAVHQLAPVLQWQRVPVLTRVAAFGHRIEADVRHVFRNRRVESAQSMRTLALGAKTRFALRIVLPVSGELIQAELRHA